MAVSTARAQLVTGPTVVPVDADASPADTSTSDDAPRLEVDGLPGLAQPFVVRRAYTGSSGRVVEHVAVLDPDGQEVARSTGRPLTLHGPETPSETASRFDGIAVADPRPLTVVCRVDDVEVGRVDLAVAAPGGGDLAVATKATLEQALKKGTILWVAADDPPGPTRPAWFVVNDGRVYLLTGPGEQDLVGLPDARRARIYVRSKDVRSLVGDVPADVERVPADDPRFERFLSTALTKRLNLPDGDAAADRWRREATLLELTPRLPGLEPPARTPIAPAEKPSDDTSDTGAEARDATADAAKGEAASTAEGEAPPADDIDREVYEQLIAEGKDERVARSKAKAAMVKKRRRGEA